VALSRPSGRSPLSSGIDLADQPTAYSMWHLRSMASEDGSEPLRPAGRADRSFSRLAVRILISSVAVIGLAALTWWEGSQRVQTSPAQVSVAVPIAVIVLGGLILGAGRQRQASRAWLAQDVRTVSHGESWTWPFAAGVIIWILLLGAVFGWDVYSFLRQSPALPTLSYLIGRITRFHLGRSGLYLVWLAVGLWLALAQRQRRPSDNSP